MLAKEDAPYAQNEDEALNDEEHDEDIPMLRTGELTFISPRWVNHMEKMHNWGNINFTTWSAHLDTDWIETNIWYISRVDDTYCLPEERRPTTNRNYRNLTWVLSPDACATCPRNLTTLVHNISSYNGDALALTCKGYDSGYFHNDVLSDEPGTVVAFNLDAEIPRLIETVLSDSRCHDVNYPGECLSARLFQDIDCQVYGFISRLQLIAFPLWVIILVAWNCSLWVHSPTTINASHRLLSTNPVLKVFISFFSIFVLAQCPWKSVAGFYIHAIYMILIAVYRTYFLTYLVLMSKGWMTTTNEIRGFERIVVIMMVGLTFLVLFVYTAWPKPMQMLTCCFYLGGCGLNLAFCSTTLRVLARRQAFARHRNLQEMRLSLEAKMRMLTILRIVATLYCLVKGEIVIYTAHPEVDIFATSVDTVSDIVAFCIVAVIFRPRVLFTMSQDIPSEEEEEELVILYQCSSELDAQGMDDPNGPVIISNPTQRGDLWSTKYGNVTLGVPCT